jgi:hypothetical protein
VSEDELARYAKSFKNEVLTKLLPPNKASLENVSRDVDASIGILER